MLRFATNIAIKSHRQAIFNKNAIISSSYAPKNMALLLNNIKPTTK
jgi:uncharacterized protein YfaT (DUF1175 family)